MAKLKFTKTTLDNMLEEIEDMYFEGRNTFDEVITIVKDAYKEEIKTLEKGPLWISGVIE